MSKPHLLIDYIAPRVTTREDLVMIHNVMNPMQSFGFATQVLTTQQFSETASQMMHTMLFMGQGLSAMQLVILSQALNLDISHLIELQHAQLLMDVSEEMDKLLTRMRQRAKETELVQPTPP